MTETYFVRKVTVDYVYINPYTGEEQIVKEGSRVLIIDDGTGTYIFNPIELTKDELIEQREDNECFSYTGSVTTRKGHKVDCYMDRETCEEFFYVNK